MIAIYRNLLRLYPGSYRREFGAEMTATFAELESEAAAAGAARHFRWLIHEAAGLFSGALQEHWREFVMRRLTVRGDFRFPQTTWVLMTIILAGVLMAIYKGEAISVSVPPSSPAVGPIHPASGVMSSLTISFLWMYAAGVLVGCALFLVRRMTARLEEK